MPPERDYYVRTKNLIREATPFRQVVQRIHGVFHEREEVAVYPARSLRANLLDTQSVLCLQTAGKFSKPVKSRNMGK
jgi:hypothetical protein